MGKALPLPGKWVQPAIVPIGKSPFDKLDPKAIPVAERFPWQPPELVAVIGTHADRTWSRSTDQLALSPDGRLFATGARESPLIVWDVATRTRKLEFPATALTRSARSPNDGPDGAVAFASDSKRIVVRVEGDSLSTADVVPAPAPAYVPWKGGPAAGQAIRVFLSPDGQRCITVGRTLQFWNVAASPAKLLHKIEEPFNIRGFAVTPDCTRLAFFPSQKERKIVVLDVSNTEVKERWRLEDRILADRVIALSDDGTRLVATTNTLGELIIWDLQDPPFPIRFMSTFKGLDTRKLAFTHDGKKVLWGMGTSHLSLWDVAKAKPTHLWTKQLLCDDGNSPAQWVILPDNKTLISFAAGGLIQYIDISGPEPKWLNPLAPSEPWYGGIVVDQVNGRVALTRAHDRRSQWWDLTGTTPTLTDLVTEPGAVEFTPDGRKQVLEIYDKNRHQYSLFVRDGAKNQAFPLEYVGHFSANGDYLWTGSSKGPTALDLRGPTPQAVTLPITSPSLSGDSTSTYLLRHEVVYPQTTGNTTTYWDLTTRLPRKLLHWQHAGDGRRGTILFPSAERMCTIVDGHWNSYALTPDGWQLVSTSPDGGFGDRDAATWHPSEKWYVAARGSDIMLRRTDNHAILATWKLKSSPLRLTFAPDGRHLFIATGHHTIYVLRLSDLGGKTPE